MRENTDQKNSEYGHFSCGVFIVEKSADLRKSPHKDVGFFYYVLYSSAKTQVELKSLQLQKQPPELLYKKRCS